MSSARLGVSVYPSTPCSTSAVHAALECGVEWFFTSLHIPEIKNNCRQATILGGSVSPGKGQVVADCSPQTFAALLASTSNLRPFKDMGLAAIRLDYGFDQEEIQAMVKTEDSLRIILNASTMALQGWIDQLPRERVEFWHNFYPRPETGLSLDFVRSTSHHLNSLGFKVGAFLPYLASPRQPLGYGLPTVERHRHMPTLLAAAELLRLECLDIIVMGDPCQDKAMLSNLKTLIEDEITTLRVINNSLLQVERECAFVPFHLTRPDQGEYVIRSATSRQMATLGRSIPARNCALRPQFSVTIDNELYGRYSGELQITLVDLPEDPRVNVIGRIASDDWPLIPLISPGAKIRLIEV